MLNKSYSYMLHVEAMNWISTSSDLTSHYHSQLEQLNLPILPCLGQTSPAKNFYQNGTREISHFKFNQNFINNLWYEKGFSICSGNGSNYLILNKFLVS